MKPKAKDKKPRNVFKAIIEAGERYRGLHLTAAEVYELSRIPYIQHFSEWNDR